ncbi:MAG: hypothetical protein ACE37K_08315 [Planctomycetota bacterium]
MITFEQARDLALRWRNDPEPKPYYTGPRNDIEFVVADELTIERPWGWMFFVVPRKHARFYGGGGPLIVERDTGRILETGSAHAHETYLRRYEATGDPHLQPGRVVVVESVAGEPDPLAVARHLYSEFGVSVVRAKWGLDGVAAGRAFCVELSSEERADALRRYLVRGGYVARQVSEHDRWEP